MKQVALAVVALITGLKNPESVVVTPEGQVYVSQIGEFDKDGDGSIVAIKDGKAIPFATGLNDPKGLAVVQQTLYVADKTRIWQIDADGTVEIFVSESAFPSPPKFLNDLAADAETGALYVSDSGDLKGNDGAVYRISPKGVVELVVDSAILPGLKIPNGLALDGGTHLLVGDFGSGELHRVKLANRTSEKIADGLGGIDGLAWDNQGQLFITDWLGSRLFVIPRPGDKPMLLSKDFDGAADLCLNAAGDQLLIPSMKAGKLVSVADSVPGYEVDKTPLPLETVVAFPQLKWKDWSPTTEDGQPAPLRPLDLTHAGDGSNRIFVATEQGVIHVFPNGPDATETQVFLDLQDRVKYDDKTNEEGFLGLAFHPNYKQNGELFVFYTPRDKKQTNRVSRFRVSKDDANRADRDSEEVLLEFNGRPFWNHDGGTLCFGWDGYLYIIHGDGGKADDPFDNAQNLQSLLGKILRIDVNHRTDGNAYAIPLDNPFVNTPDARPEIWAYGLRNVWRMAFDSATGRLWASDAGQNLFEEIDLIERGGNYGWNRREALHPFGAKGTGPSEDYAEPIWEYPHTLGKSITGGSVYRGKKLPELEGHYIYGDYITGFIRALKYDEAKKRVVADRPIKDRSLPILSFGTDETGEIYLLTTTLTGEGLYRFEKQAKSSGQ
jgi:glucose/arabinose dehydrogenase